MKVVSLPRKKVHSGRVSDVEKYINESRTEFNLILSDILNDKELEAHKAECMIFRRLLSLGLILLKVFFAGRGTGDYGRTVETAKGTAVRGRTVEKTYFSIFGKIKVLRYLYRTDKETFAPWDIALNLPVRCYSYFLAEILNLLNIKGAYAEGTGFMKKIFDLQVSVSASETVSGESASGYEKYYGQFKTFEKFPTHDIKADHDYTVVSFDGKGIPMIKKEAAKIKGRQGKGQKRQKKKEALVGVKYNIGANIRNAGEVAHNPVYPENRKEVKTQVKAHNIRYIASIAKSKKKVMGEIYEEITDEDFSTTPLLCLMDGSPYLWDYLKTVFGEITNRVCILDIIHVLEYIWIIAHIMYKEGSDNSRKYVFEKLELILEGNVDSYITELQTDMLTGRWKKKSHQEKFKKVITYFKNHRQYMKYDEYLSEGYPIGTGVVESACGHLVRDRMEISGARWGIDGAESVLRLRSVVKSGDWDDYWEFYTSQAGRNEFFPDGYNLSDIKEKRYA